MNSRKPELAREMMKVVFARIGSTDVDAAVALISSMSGDEKEAVKAEAMRKIAA